jgi:hypothetical protein
MFRTTLWTASVFAAIIGTSPLTSSQVAKPTARTPVRFTGPAGMEVRYYVRTADGKETYANRLVAPARYNFPQGAVYRLKLSHIPGYPGLEVYPTLEVPAVTVHDQSAT